MCLAIPGKLLERYDDAAGLRMGRVNFGGIVKQICLEYTPAAVPGDYVLVHVGFALGSVDETEANKTFRLLAEMQQLSELNDGDREGATMGSAMSRDDPISNPFGLSSCTTLSQPAASHAEAAPASRVVRGDSATGSSL